MTVIMKAEFAQLASSKTRKNLNQTIIVFQSKVDSQRFVKYICDQVLPQWDAIAKLEQGQLFQLAILRQLAELSTHCGKLDHPAAYVVQIFDKTKVNLNILVP